MQKLDTADMHPTALLPSNRAIDTAVKLAAMVPPRQLEPGPSQPETPDRPRTVGRTRRVSMLASMPVDGCTAGSSACSEAASHV